MQSLLLAFPCANIVLLILPAAQSCTRSTLKWHLAALLPHASAYSTTFSSKQAVEPANQLTVTHAASVRQSSWNHRKQSRRMGGELAEHCDIGGTRCVLSLHTAYEGAHSPGHVPPCSNLTSMAMSVEVLFHIRKVALWREMYNF